MGNVDDLSLCMGILMRLHMCNCMMSMWMIYYHYIHFTHIHTWIQQFSHCGDKCGGYFGSCQLHYCNVPSMCEFGGSG